ncbi:MAG: SAM-dependent DNA methyltransferase [Nitrospirae bacterium]|nr:MAG: SAM-dependent DNA methyltransferase [Nitrospirota bacterium]
MSGRETTTPTRLEGLRNRIANDAAEITRRIREAAAISNRNEARFRTLFAQIIEPWAQNLDIPLLVREERTLATGRADATYNRMIIEYEAPGSLRDNVSHHPTAHAIQQAKDYVEGVGRQERQPIHRLIGVVIDGHYFIYVRKVEGHWIDPEIEEVNEHSVARFLRLLVSLVSGKALLPENLVRDFGSNTLYAQRIASSLYRSLSGTLDDNQADIVDKLFEQWRTFFGEVTGYEEHSSPLRNRPELGQFARGMGLDVRNVDPTRLFFTVHTYFALLIKLIAYYALSRFVSGFGTRFGSMYRLDDEDLKREMEELERGGIFRTLGIRNFLEGDFFKWYLYTWDANVAQAIRTLLDRLKDYDPGTLEVSPEQARDLLKKLYHRLMPREIRHDLGEYYTPDWLAEHVLNELGYEGQPDKRLLDPACGSGTFLVLAIKRLKERCFREGLNEQETLETILNNIVGIDLNPLAVVAARTNYLLALGDLLAHRTWEIDIPVYLADSILTPAAGEELFNHDRYELNTVVGQFDIPSCLKTREQIDNLCNLLEECVTNQVNQDVFLDRARRALTIDEADWIGGNGRGEGARRILETLFRRLAALHADGLDGIWARILQNAFMPLFLGQFDLIAGNPPWIGWEALPNEYRTRTHPLWVRYGLFPHSGMETILGRGKKDLSMLMSYVVTDRLLRAHGLLGFIITQSVFKTAGAGQGFRRFCWDQRGIVRVECVDDMTDFQPFENASNRTSVFIWRKGRRTTYPVQYRLWQKTALHQSIDQDAALHEVRSMTRCLLYVAEPVDNNDPTAPWLTARPRAVEAIRQIVGHSDYKAHEGVNTGGNNAVYWVEIIYERPDGVVVIRNLTEGAKRNVPSVNAELEPDLLYPLLRGREVRRWQAKRSAYIILAQDVATRRGIDPEIMQWRFPKTYAYLKRFEKQLRGRAAFKRYYTRREDGRIVETGPFYSMFDVGKYTLSPFKTVWHRMVAPIGAVVVGKEAGKPILPQETHVYVGLRERREAFYLAGMLNSTPFNFAAMAYSQAGGKSFGSPHILDNLYVPKFDPNEGTHRHVAELAASIQVGFTAMSADELAAAEAELDEATAGVWSITDDQLAEIHESYRELTKADLREAGEADEGREESSEAGEVGGGKDCDTTAAVVSALVGNGEMAAAEIAAALGIDNTASLRPVLRQLIESGRVERIGRGRGTRYRLVEGSEA